MGRSKLPPHGTYERKIAMHAAKNRKYKSVAKKWSSSRKATKAKNNSSTYSTPTYYSNKPLGVGGKIFFGAVALAIVGVILGICISSFKFFLYVFIVSAILAIVGIVIGAFFENDQSE